MDGNEGDCSFKNVSKIKTKEQQECGKNMPCEMSAVMTGADNMWQALGIQRDYASVDQNKNCVCSQDNRGVSRENETH